MEAYATLNVERKTTHDSKYQGSKQEEENKNCLFFFNEKERGGVTTNNTSHTPPLQVCVRQSIIKSLGYQASDNPTLTRIAIAISGSTCGAYAKGEGRVTTTLGLECANNRGS